MGRSLRGATVCAALALASCATPVPEYRMIPTAEHGVGVRFSRGNAAMISNGPSGSIMLLPVRYNSSSKLFFVIAAFNTSGRPINIGTEDVRIYLDDGRPIRVQDFNYLRQESKREAERAMAAAWISAGIEGYLAYQGAEGHPRRTEIAYRRASGEFYLSSTAIERGLRQAISSWGRRVLQTTTVDSGTATAGFIYADQLLIPEGSARAIVVDVNFGGSPHQFTINLASSSSAFEVPTNIPAVPAQTMQGMQRTPETYHWTDGPPPSPLAGVPVIE